MRSSQIIQMDSKPNVKYPLKRHTEKRHRGREVGGHVKMEADIGVMQPEARIGWRH